MDILKELFKLKDEKYADFQMKLTPGIPKEKFIGVRVPELRKLAKVIVKENDYRDFLKDLPHKYYDENMLHSLLLNELKDYNDCLFEVEKFLPNVDNWAVCDILSPKIFKKHKDTLINEIRRWAYSPKTYTCRFGLEMLMSFYLDDDFKAEYLEIASEIRSDEYYVNMMIAWFFATALAKQWDSTLPYIENHRLDKWTNNKSIQKARESYRITPERKELLNEYKIK